MSNIPNLFEHYKLHALDTSRPPLEQPNNFESWVKEPPNNIDPPASSDITKPRAIEFTRFPGNYIDIKWGGGAVEKQKDSALKRLCEFAVALFADRTATSENLHLRRTIMSGAHSETHGGSTAASEGRKPRLDGEHVTGRYGSGNNEVKFHGYFIYPQGVPLGGSEQDKKTRASNPLLTTAEAVFASKKLRKTNPKAEFDPDLNEDLGSEIMQWFKTEFTKPERAADITPRILFYDSQTMKVSVYKQAGDGKAEHTFNNLCKLPAQKLASSAGTSGTGAAPGAAGPSTSTGKKNNQPPAGNKNSQPGAGNSQAGAGTKNNQSGAASKPPPGNNQAGAGTKNNQPGAASKPPPGNNQAGAGTKNNQPGAASKPLPGNNQPPAGNKNSQPGAGNNQAGAGTKNNQPGAANKLPTGNNQAGAGTKNNQPGAASKPPPGNNQPGAANKLPTGNNQPPAGNNQAGPGTKNNQSGAASKPPPGNNQPGATSKPPPGNNQPPARNNQAGAANKPPPGNNQPPAGNNQAGAGTNNQPGAASKPPPGNNQPPARNNQPGAANKPPPGNNQPPAGNKPPAAGKDQPAKPKPKPKLESNQQTSPAAGSSTQGSTGNNGSSRAPPKPSGAKTKGKDKTTGKMVWLDQDGKVLGPV